MTQHVFPQHHRRLPVLYGGTSEATIRDFLLKKVLRPEACNFIKKETQGTGAFLLTLRNFLEHIFLKNPSGRGSS